MTEFNSKSITVLGAGAAGLTLVEKIRDKDKERKITLIDREDCSFCRKDFLSNPANYRVNIKLSEWADSKKVEFIQRCAERINIKRRKIYCKDGDSVSFDILVIATGLVSKKIPIKGAHKEGFFYFSKIDTFSLKSLLKISTDATVYVSTWLGIKLSLALSSLGKEVRVVASNFDFLGGHSESVIKSLEQKNVAFYFDSLIEEAIGEGMVKAVKISPLKVFPSQLIFIDSGFTANIGFFEEEPGDSKISISDYPGVYLLGDINRKDISEEAFFIDNYENAVRQGESLAEFFISGKEPFLEMEKVDENRKIVEIENILKEGKLWQSGLV